MFINYRVKNKFAMVNMLQKPVWSFLLTFVLIVALGFFMFQKPAITGLIIYEEGTYVKNWTFDSTSDYYFDNSLISLSDGEAKLVKNVAEQTWSIDNLTDIYVTSAFEYEPDKNKHDRTSKVQSVDNEEVDVHRNKDIFDVTFAKEIANNDVISLYILEADEYDDESLSVAIYLCDNGTFCNSSNYGSLIFNGSKGWYNITVTGLSSNRSSFNLDPTQNVKFDYVKTVHKDTTTYKSTNISYPESASIETKDFSATGLLSFSNFAKNELLNEQNVAYHYSTDSGNSWNAMLSSSNISINNGKLRIMANLSGNGTLTPIVYDFAVLYTTKVCNENWNITHGACLSNDKRLIYYVDKNDCGTSNNIPSDNGNYEICDFDNNPPNITRFQVSPTPTNISAFFNISVVLADETQVADVIASVQNPDENAVKILSLSNDSKWGYYSIFDTENIKEGIYFVDITANDSNGNKKEYENLGLIVLASNAKGIFANSSMFLKQNEKNYIDARQSANTLLEIKTESDVAEAVISVAEYSKNIKDSNNSLAELGKYVDIVADNRTMHQMSYMTVRIYYTDEEIANSGLDEESLKIHYFNETSSQWQILNSSVNSSGNYIEATLKHLSTFGVFGEKKVASSQSQPSSGGSSSGGRASSSTTTSQKIEQKITQPELKTDNLKEEPLKEEKIESGEAKQQCEYKIYVSIPEDISLIEYDYINGIIHNIGNCNIESLSIDVSSELKDIIKIENSTMQNIGVNESIEFFVKKLATKTESSLIQGFSVKIAGKNIETYNGSLNLDALSQNRSFEEKVNIKVNVLKPAKQSFINSTTFVIFGASALLLIAFYVFYRIRKKGQM